VSLSSTDSWAVGSNGLRPIIEHWDGTSWTATITPSPPTANSMLTSISATGGSDVWAVGSASGQTLVEHWDGGRWRNVTSPNVPEDYNTLLDVVAIGAADVWAVGYHEHDSDLRKPLVEHWDGTAWTILSGPHFDQPYNVLSAVTRVGRHDAWTVGYDYVNLHGLAAHWNGRTWRVASTPTIGISSPLIGTDAVSRSDVWAVGLTNSPDAAYTLAEHWDGSSWSVATTPNVGEEFNTLNDVAMRSATDGWAVGGYDSNVARQTLTERWDGSAWTVVLSPNVGPGDNQLLGVATEPATSGVWAVGTGSDEHSFETPLIEYFC
jgi:hypothetical protein